MRALLLSFFVTLLLAAPAHADEGSRPIKLGLPLPSFLAPVMERGHYLHEDDVFREAITFDEQVGFSLSLSERFKVDAGWALAMRAVSLGDAPEFLRQGPWIALKFDF